jgi:hypothetical protein
MTKIMNEASQPQSREAGGEREVIAKALWDAEIAEHKRHNKREYGVCRMACGPAQATLLPVNVQDR